MIMNIQINKERDGHSDDDYEYSNQIIIKIIKLKNGKIPLEEVYTWQI